MSSLQPFTLYYYGPSPNPFKVAIILEELGLPWEFAEIPGGDLKGEAYTSLNPNGRVPVLVDHNRNITLWESGAIIDYLIAEYDPSAKLHYTTFPEKHTTRTWEHFQMSGQGPYFGQASWFINFHPEKLQSAIDRYCDEIRRVCAVVQGHLARQGTGYLVGDRVTYADLMWLPYFKVLPNFAPTIDLGEFPGLEGWLGRLYARPAVARVFAMQDEAVAAMLAKRAQEAAGQE